MLFGFDRWVYFVTMIKSEYKTEKSSIKCQADRLIDILELSQNPEYQDVTIICDNGRLNVNSFLLASVFPVLRKLNYSEWGELIFITLRGLDCNDLQRVLDSIYQQETKISLPSSLHKLMENKSKDFWDKVSLLLQDLDIVKKISLRWTLNTVTGDLKNSTTSFIGAIEL